MKKLAFPLLLMAVVMTALAGCQKKATVPAAATKTETQIDQYVQKVNQLYRDDAHQKTASLSAPQKNKIIKSAQTLDDQITPNLYMSGIHNRAKKSFKSAKSDLQKVTGQTTTSVAKTPAKPTTSQTKTKTSAFFDQAGIVKSDAKLGQAADYAGHPKQLANYQEAKNQLAAITVVRNLFTDDSYTTIPATLTTNDFTYARSMVNKADHKAFKTKYLAHIESAEKQFKNYSNTTNQTATATQNTTTTDQTAATNTTTANTTAANTTATNNSQVTNTDTNQAATTDTTQTQTGTAIQ